MASALGALGAGVAFGYFSSTATGTGDATIGHLHLLKVTTGPATETYTCTISGMTPGESSTGWSTGTKTDTPCAFTVALTTSGSAYLGLSLAATGSLYVPTTSLSLRFAVTDTTGVTYTTSGTLKSNTATHPLYIGTFTSSGTHTFTVNFSLPSIAPSTLEGETTTLVLTVHAISGSATGPASSCTPGTQCAGITRWS